jgi:hypothetical protein
MAEKRKPIEVSRRIEAPAALIFKILASPTCSGVLSWTVLSPTWGIPSP